MFQFSGNIDLKPSANFHENRIRTLSERIILNLTSAMIVFFPPCNHLLVLIFLAVLLDGASTTAKNCLPKDRGKMGNLSISMVSFRISHSFQ